MQSSGGFLAIVKRAAILVFNALLVLLVWALYQPHHDAWQKGPTWGNAAPDVRAAVLGQLSAFQDGYAKRDTGQVDAFMSRLFSRDHTLVLGTMPGEIYPGYARASEIIRTDWESWGDCRFRIDQTQVSAVGDVAWFATVGSVKFDLSRFLVLPLRLSGVMVNEQGTWKLRQAQFQFDLDLSPLLVLNMVLLVWLGVNAVWLLVVAYRRLGFAPLTPIAKR
jgi:hypothetical protein